VGVSPFKPALATTVTAILLRTPSLSDGHVSDDGTFRNRHAPPASSDSKRICVQCRVRQWRAYTHAHSWQRWHVPSLKVILVCRRLLTKLAVSQFCTSLASATPSSDGNFS